MKKPDEIKKGLECCTQEECHWDNGCPYGASRTCAEDLKSDALALIQQLEADKVSLLESSHEMRKDMCSRIQRLEVSNGALRILMKKLESQVPRWISVEEKLPEVFATVLIMRDDIKQACVGWLIDGHWSVPKGVRVTHWMPLPEPPEKE